jgi:hypothetical protein
MRLVQHLPPPAAALVAPRAPAGEFSGRRAFSSRAAPSLSQMLHSTRPSALSYLRRLLCQRLRASIQRLRLAFSAVSIRMPLPPMFLTLDLRQGRRRLLESAPCLSCIFRVPVPVRRRWPPARRTASPCVRSPLFCAIHSSHPPLARHRWR